MIIEIFFFSITLDLYLASSLRISIRPVFHLLYGYRKFYFIEVSIFVMELVHSYSVKKSSLIRQKGKSQNGCFKKTKYAEFSKKNEHFLPPDTHTYVRNSRVF